MAIYTDWGAGGFAIFFVAIAILIVTLSLDLFKGAAGLQALAYGIAALLLIVAAICLVTFLKSISR